MQADTYLNFAGNAEEALRFYAAALEGKLGQIARFGDMPGSQAPAKDAGLVMHGAVTYGSGQVLMASDVPAVHTKKLVVGTNAYISLHPDSRKQADRLFAALSKGGEVEVPMGDQPWGDYWDAFTDKYGTQWMINFHDASKDPTPS